MKRKILIVEDSLTVRRMLTQAIAQQTGLEIDAFDTLEGARDCQGEEYVVALVDLTLPDAPSGEAVNVLLDRGLPVVILTADISEEKREAWLEAGVLDYVMKDSRHSLQYAVSLVHRLYLNQAIEVLVEIAHGLSNQEIADKLFISLPTVKTHVAHILSKINARDRVQAVVFAYENHLV